MRISEDIQNEALNLVNDERSEWESALTQVTSKVQFKTRDAIETFRKNYWGVFDTPNPEAVWMPVTEQAVEDSFKNMDLDLKDLRQIAQYPNSKKFTAIARVVIKNKLADKFFGEDLDLLERSLCIDGTAIWKTWKGKNKEGKMDLMYSQVDLLNFYIDPLAKSIYEADAVIERSTPTIKDFKAIEELENTEDMGGSENVLVYGNNGLPQKTGKTKHVEAFERFGLMPKYFITGDKENDTKLIEGRIVTSGTGKDKKLHLIAKNTDGIKPYEEAWYKRIPGRWYGRGVAEMVLSFQVWANMVKNIHITRQKVSQLGIFKVKKGSNITPQMLKGMSVNGAISVNNMDDIEQMVMQEASLAHYEDMKDIKQWVEGVTSAVSAISPENLPASAPATTSVINDRNNKSAFTTIREGLGGFLQRWADRHAKPIIFKLTKMGEVISLLGEDAPKELIEQIVARNTIKALTKSYEKGIVPTKIEVERAMARAVQSMKGKEIMVTMEDVMEAGNFKTRTVVTNEIMDIAVTVQNIISLLPYINPNDTSEYVAEVFDLMGLTPPSSSPEAQNAPVEGETEQAPNPAQTLQGLTTKANTVQGGLAVV